MALYVPERKIWTTQPTENCRLHPDWQKLGLIAAYNGYTGIHYGTKTESYLYGGCLNAFTINSPVYGRAVGRGGASLNNALYSNLSTTSDTTMIVAANCKNVTTSVHTTKVGTVNTPLYFISTCVDGATAGKIGCSIYLGGTLRNVGGSTTLPVNSVFIAAFRHIYNTEQRFWLNGLEDPVVSNFTGALATTTHFAADANYNNSVFYAALFNKALPSELILELQRNPWQIFAPRRQWFAMTPEPDTTRVLQLPSFAFTSDTTKNRQLPGYFISAIEALPAYQSKIYRSGVWTSVPIKRYNGTQWVSIVARPSV